MLFNWLDKISPPQERAFWLVVSILFYLPFLGAVPLFDWDEINFAECAREMILLDDYLRVHIGFMPFWEKPPLFFWLQVLCMKLVGINEYAARLPNALCGIVSLQILFGIGSKLRNRTLGRIWLVVYFGSLLPHLYFKSAIIDPVFNLFIFLSIYFLVLYKHKKGYTSLIWASLMMSLAVFTKGPAAYIIVCLSFGVLTLWHWYDLYLSKNWTFSFPLPLAAFVLFSFGGLLLILAWYGVETLQNGPWLAIEFTKYQYRLFSTPDAGHKGFFGYHFVVLLVGCFPMSLFALSWLSGRLKSENEIENTFQKWQLVLFWVVLLLFSAVQSKIVHYSSLCYFPLSYLAARGIYELHNKPLPSWLWWFLGIMGTLIGAIIAAFPVLALRSAQLKQYIADPFAQANLDAEVNWQGWEGIAGILFLVGLWYGLKVWQQRQFSTAFISIFGGMALMLWLTLNAIVPKIERYSQGAAIDFYKSIASKQPAYVFTVGFKSYAHWFYSNLQPEAKPNNLDSKLWFEWLMTQKLDKPAYFVAKINKLQDLEPHRTLLDSLYSKNGFVFYKKKH
ncbi:MAG: glycosyl transferase [Cytophagales bacterium]|nr:MAG: glycosyl transferase [Cytophagales bacterium]